MSTLCHGKTLTTCRRQLFSDEYLMASRELFLSEKVLRPFSVAYRNEKLIFSFAGKDGNVNKSFMHNFTHCTVRKLLFLRIEHNWVSLKSFASHKATELLAQILRIFIFDADSAERHKRHTTEDSRESIFMNNNLWRKLIIKTNFHSCQPTHIWVL